MKRTIFLALIAALALTIGLSSVATADQGSADASAKASKKGKKGKRGKGKACKGKRGKGRSRGKARRSASASAKGKKGRKGKARGCKGGGKAAPGWPLRGGEYEGQDGIELKVTSGGKMASLTVGSLPCFGLPFRLPEERATSTAKSFKAGGATTAIAGGYGAARWSIEVTPQLRYKVTLDSSHAFPDQDPCDSKGVRYSGTLKKKEG